jgi:glutamate racemase
LLARLRILLLYLKTVKRTSILAKNKLNFQIGMYNSYMKIGIFDSGLGGLIITHALKKELGKYDYLYLGDTKNLPYGDKSKEQIYEMTKKGLDYLFQNDCKLVIVACNSASADALRKIQQEFIPEKWPDRKALGVLIPSAEVAVEKGKNIGIICTRATAESGAFDREIGKLSEAKVLHQATPELVDHIEKGDYAKAHSDLRKYLDGLIQAGVDTLVLGCTHYPAIKDEARSIMGGNVAVVSQDEIIPAKLEGYLKKHEEIQNFLSQGSTIRFLLTKKTKANEDFAKELFKGEVFLEEAEL